LVAWIERYFILCAMAVRRHRRICCASKLRDSLVRARVALINSVRFTLKSLGYAVRNSSSESFHKVVTESLPEGRCQMIAPSVQALAELTRRIKLLEREIRALARTKYPQTVWLEQIPGVGPITALYFVLKIEDAGGRWDRAG
jgi:transposase